ncbi:sulfate ABC transporter permease subunit CysT [Aliarcobacter trophiarum LMG 25534]|uniref:Sulfate transport system permease protein CysT n=1 Tax=Aliarcobacter trophiarum LMG 25534 TaxID=1032241 RepID=A0AAD0VNL2_9BACT|nr:sulfate ABC transporter permease subunit CysT [Aliarcobacter trophiarum]AXK49770.1 sulfate ABC transporter CysATW, permease protein CysT [Aliarcobacter trophiarum LMG 25534]RXI28092.1 sulfate ABC transporter permease subunit CysT [Aliarcobacter trophiarum]RXJ92454.1 sulfate ABC transporter permease subunit CysT [Aliarcobacter trophiarum LMG 25534]
MRLNFGILKRSNSPIPGFGLTIGYTVFYLSIIVLIPIIALFTEAFSMGFDTFIKATTDSRVIASYKLTFATSFIAAVINTIFGLIVAWCLVRYTFFGKRVFDAIVDLPFALPTAVSGIALTTLYSSQGWFGQYLEPLGLKIVFTPIGITVALIFIGVPFVVRTVQPALEEIQIEQEEASASLGASRWQTFYKVILPTIFPAVLTGFSLSFARALGEYGSVVFIAGNMPFKTEISTLLIITKLEQYDYAGATAIAVMMLLISFMMLLLINILQRWSSKRKGMEAI